jgi:hypothetical protein
LLLLFAEYKRDGPVADISLKRGEISHTGMEISPYNTHKQASPVPGMKIQRYHNKLFLTTVKTIKLLTQEKFIPLTRLSH